MGGGPHLQHTEVPRVGVKLELQLLVYTTAAAIPDLSSICDLYCSLQIRDPLSEARDGTAPPGGFLTLMSHDGNSSVLGLRAPSWVGELGVRACSSLAASSPQGSGDQDKGGLGVPGSGALAPLVRYGLSSSKPRVQTSPGAQAGLNAGLPRAPDSSLVIPGDLARVKQGALGETKVPAVTHLSFWGGEGG